jgi:hypothetical protein
MKQEAVTPYRSSGLLSILPTPKPWWGARAWRKLFGKLAYTGPRVCSHCKHWTPATREVKEWSALLCTNVWKRREDPKGKGDCKLLYGKEDRFPEDGACDDERFQPKRRYMHRVKI